MWQTLASFTLWGTSIVLFALGIHSKDSRKIGSGILLFIFHPFITEGIRNIYAWFARSSLSKPNDKKFDGHFPIVYSKGYNITAFGLEKMHPFDSTKYGRVFQGLKDKEIIDNAMRIWEPDLPSQAFLTEIMSKWYLLKLHYSPFICSCLEVPLFFLPAWFLRSRVLDPMMRATQGSVDAACMAMKHQWAINLSGGYHHASCNRGGGFCIYPDITLVVHFVRKWYQKRRVMIVDLDAHQGNGHERDHIGDRDIFILDAYNHYIYPGDGVAAQAIAKPVYVAHGDNDDSYLQKTQTALSQSIDHFRPEFVIYNAGTDCMQGDPLGRMNLSPNGIIKRDELVFQLAFENQVPILMVLSGGY